MISFSRYVHDKSTKMLNLHYHKSIGKIKEHEEKKDLVVYDFILDKVLDNIKEATRIMKFDDTKILID